MKAPNFEAVVAAITKSDKRFDPQAYFFVRDGLDFTQERIRKTEKVEMRHICGQELLLGLRDYALSQFGPMTHFVLSQWGVSGCEDFGEIVFVMVDHQLLSKTEQDCREDFKGGYDFDEAFRHPFEGIPPLKTQSGS